MFSILFCSSFKFQVVMMDMSNWPRVMDQLKYMLDVHTLLLVKLYSKGVPTDERFGKLCDESKDMNKTMLILTSFTWMTCEQQSNLLRLWI